MAKWNFPEKSIKEMDAEISAVIESTIRVEILPMKLSDNRTEFWVTICRNNVQYATNKYSEKYANRARYERDMLKYTLFGTQKPNLADAQYADPKD